MSPAITFRSPSTEQRGVCRHASGEMRREQNIFAAARCCKGAAGVPPASGPRLFLQTLPHGPRPGRNDHARVRSASASSNSIVRPASGPRPVRVRCRFPQGEQDTGAVSHLALGGAGVALACLVPPSRVGCRFAQVKALAPSWVMAAASQFICEPVLSQFPEVPEACLATCLPLPPLPHW
eukprot:gene24188-biopygen11888